MSLKFDRFFLEIPAETIQIIDLTKFETTVSGESKNVTVKYKQLQPFYYKIIKSQNKDTALLEFSGKSLLDQYPMLIDKTTISSCIENINNCGICHINWSAAYPEAVVKQCDVTADVDSPHTIADIQKNLIISDKTPWHIASATINRFSLENTATCPRYRCRMIIYDKDVEFTRPKNLSFLDAITNADEQRDYFKGKIRYELNLQSASRINYFLKVPDKRLTSVLDSKEDPIRRILSDTILQSSPIDVVAENSSSLKMLGNLLICCLCQFQPDRIKYLVKKVCNSSSTSSKAMKSLRKTISDFNSTNTPLSSDEEFQRFVIYLHQMIDSTLKVSEKEYSNNLLTIYDNSRLLKSNNTIDYSKYLVGDLCPSLYNNPCVIPTLFS